MFKGPSSSDDILTRFGAAVRECRGKLGVSQEELAERAGLHRTYVSDIERGARNLSLSSIDKLARALEVSISALLSRERQKASARGPGSLVDILLVEDELSDVELTLRAFKKARIPNHVHVARDGAEALDYLFRTGSQKNRQLTHRPQLVLLDLNLPKISGLEVLRQMRGDRRTRTIPVIILTVSEKDADIAECQRLGADTYLVKPVNFVKLNSTTLRMSFNWGLMQSVTVR